MIDRATVEAMKSWFRNYVTSFNSADPEVFRNIRLKEDHTKRVCGEILDIGGSLHLKEEDLNLSEIIALFHDIGRFEQYSLYGTFADFNSIDHALLGAEILRKESVLENLSPHDRDLIIRVVSYHNRALLPGEETERCLFFTRLLRDADKLDIWRVLTDYYSSPKEERNVAIELDLPDREEISERVYSDLMKGRIVRMNSLRTFNDFKLLQVAWVFDLNFQRTFEIVRKRGYLETIRRVLPKSDKVTDIYAYVYAFMKSRCPETP
jgi:putative nucleotidyltransferase with HDIG domain